MAGASTVVARLEAIGWGGGELIVPLAVGRTLLGRGIDPSSRCAPPALEQSQWLIACDASGARVCDAGSTNLSVWLPGGSDLAGVEHAGFGHAGLERAPGAKLLAHPNRLVDGRVIFAPEWQILADGDFLRSCYATFRFRRVEAMIASEVEP